MTTIGKLVLALDAIRTQHPESSELVEEAMEAFDEYITDREMWKVKQELEEAKRALDTARDESRRLEALLRRVPEVSG